MKMESMFMVGPELILPTPHIVLRRVSIVFFYVRKYNECTGS